MAKKLVIIGGGAAGFFCAINAAEQNPSLQIILLEKHNKVLQKVKVSGGGRCNVTNACTMNSELLQKYPRGKTFLKKAFQQFSTKDTVTWFKERGIELKTEPDGRMFPASNTSQTIIDCLLNKANELNVQVKLNAEVVDIQKVKNEFTIALKNGDQLLADYVFIAAGGYQKLEQYNWLGKFKHSIVPPIPSLFTFNTPGSALNELMGVSVHYAIVKIASTKLEEEGPVMITHWGLSGPAILKLSAWGARELYDKQYKFTVIVNWLGKPESDIRARWNEMRNKLGAYTMGTKNPFDIPKRLWEFLLQVCEIDVETKWSELAAKLQNKLIHELTTYAIDVEGKTTFKEEFVSCGGISLTEVDAHTMQSKLVEGLYFGGEILDVDGITGGFNFQNAWTSGYIAGKEIANATKV